MSLGTIWLWLGIAMFARALSGVSRRTRWIVVATAAVLWAYVTYFMSATPDDDRTAIVFGLLLIAVMLGGVAAEIFMGVRQLLGHGQD